MNRINTIKSHISNTNPQYTKLTVYFKGLVGYISMHSAKDLNCLSPIMLNQLCSALKQLKNDPQVNVIVIRSELQKIFCAGADIKQFSKPQFDYEKGVRYQGLHSIFQITSSIRKPIIAAVNGKALGGGFQLALMCDIIVATQNSYFALPQINLGLMPGLGGTQRLAKIIGQKKAMRYILTGQGFSGQQAYRMNVAEKGDGANFYQGVEKLAEKIASKALTSVIIAKRAIKQGSNMTMNQGLEYQRDVFYSMLNTKAAKEGINAFVSKRNPNFKGL